jgi:putrescine importer
MPDQNRELRRTLGLSSVILFGLAYMTPMIVFGTFGVLAEASQGTAAGAYLIALIAILLTAYSYGRMAAIYPIAGSAYTYTRRAFDGHVGFLVGWAVLLDYFFLPMVIWLIGAAYLQSAFPSVPGWGWILAFVVATSAINIAGIAVADRINLILMVVQFLIVAAFVGLAARYVWIAAGPAGILSAEPFFKPGVPFSATLAGAALAAYSFLGFDAITTLTEETVDPQRTMPRAIMLVALVGGAIFITAAYVTQLAHSGASFTNVDSAAYEIAKMIGGDFFKGLFLIGLIVAQFASGISAQASVGRLLFAMGRDACCRARFSAISIRGFARRSTTSCSRAWWGWSASVSMWLPPPHSSILAPSPRSPSSMSRSLPTICAAAPAGQGPARPGAEAGRGCSCRHWGQPPISGCSFILTATRFC